MTRLIDANLDLVSKCAQYLAHSHWRDYVTSGYIGLRNAERTYDAKRGASFRSHAWRRIMGEMRQQMRNETFAKRKYYRKPRSLDDRMFITSRSLDNVAEQDRFEYLIEGLSERDKLICRMKSDDRMTKDIAESLGLCPAAIQWRVRRIIRPHIKRRLSDDEKQGPSASAEKRA